MRYHVPPTSSARVALLRISGTGHGAEVRLMASLLAVVAQPLGFRTHTCVVAHYKNNEKGTRRQMIVGMIGWIKGSN